MRVAVTKGTLWVPPTYFALQHALAMPEIDWRVFTLCARVSDPAARLDIDEAVPGAEIVPMRLRTVLKWGRIRAMARRIAAWEPDLIHQHQATWSLGAVEAARRTGAPLVTTLHGFDAHLGPREAKRTLFGPTGAWNAVNRTAAFAESDLLLAVSRHLADTAIQAGADPTRLEVHYQGVDTDWWTPTGIRGDNGAGALGSTGPRGTGGDAPIVLFVGALSRLKGVPELLTAHAALSDTPHRLVLVGDGPLRRDAKAAATADPSISVVGGLERTDVREWMRAASALVLPTRTTLGRAEAAGLVLLEAQACGLPVIANAVGGAPEMVAPACRGLLADETDSASLLGALRRVLSMSEEERTEMGARGRDWVVAQRSLTGAIGQLRDYYDRVLVRGA